MLIFVRQKATVIVGEKLENTPSRRLINELPEGVKKNLSSGEEVLRYLKTWEIAERPDYIILTNLRLIYFDDKHLGRFTFKSIPFQKLLKIKAHKGAIVWGEITFKSEDGTVIHLERVSRQDIEDFIEALEVAYNALAVEPVSMKREGDLLGMTEWEYNKPAELIFRQKPSSQPSLSEDPINMLKMRFIKGEISEEEYRAKLRILQEK